MKHRGTTVAAVNSAVHLSVSREHLLRKPPEPDTDGATYPRRLDHLLGMSVHHEETRLGKVIDVRVVPGSDGTPECAHLVVGRGRPGSMLGYDRSGGMGPAILGHAIRWLHRHTGQVPFSSVTQLDWDRGTIRVGTGLSGSSRT